MTIWGWLYVLGTLGMIALVGIKCVPIYVNNYEIRSTLAWAAGQPELRDASAYEIQNRIQRRFDSGYIDNIKGSDVRVKRVENGRELTVIYEREEPLFGDVSLLFDFRETVFLPAPGS
ncbi:DUF4845 domain-containing protein [Spectribacter hydrogenoxidans]|uniref:DUF4845 domain-containing protein n=1 Tax=Spectribacter hydrogenoxidans TaxID=3075608 RepID=A0ABU3C2S3_9GAMM|nr:DUF4845 domain-containing protein [Salinisphaera sp. W335]MDT0635858.1 DUF4845 domain-containing protein [Salinisphaera sp. W335]